MNFGQRLVGTFVDPRKTFGQLAARPVWVDALILLLVLISVYTYLVFPLATHESVEMMNASEVRLKEKWGEDGFRMAVERIQNRSRELTSFFMAPFTFLVGFLFSALIIFGCGRLFSTHGNYRQVFSLLIHANFIDKLLGNAVRLFLILRRQSVLQVTTGAAVFFPGLEVTSPAYAVLNQVDVFQLWLFAIFGLGLAEVFQLSYRKTLAISFGIWFLKSLLSVLLFILQMRVLR